MIIAMHHHRSSPYDHIILSLLSENAIITIIQMIMSSSSWVIVIMISSSYRPHHGHTHLKLDYRVIITIVLICDCYQSATEGVIHDDVIKWKHFPRYWLCVRGIHWSQVNSPQKRPVTRSFDVFFNLRLE